MKILCFIFFISLFACNEYKTVNTANQYRDAAAIQLREVLGNFNCQSTLLKKDSIILGKVDHHTSTQYSFQQIDKDSIIFSYKAMLRPINLSSNQIDTGMIKLKCVNFQSPEIEEIRELVDSMLFENVNLSVWGNSYTIEALPAFTNDGRSSSQYTIQNLLKDKLSVQEINDVKYNGMYYSSPQLSDLDLSFFKGKNVIWLNEQEARDTGFYLKIYIPLFNTNKTLCFLRYDLICNRIDGCGSGTYLILKKEKGQWNQIYMGKKEF